MNHSSPYALCALAALFSPLVLATQTPEPPTELDPVSVTGIRPLIKIAEHPLVEPRFGAAVVAEGDYLYVIGGSDEEGHRLDSVERIDLRDGRSTPWAKLKIPRRHHRAVIVGGKIYVLGGTSGFSTEIRPLSDELTDYAEDREVSDAAHERNLGLTEPAAGLQYDGRENPFAPRSASPLDPEFDRTAAKKYFYENTVEVIDLATGRVTMGPAMPAQKALFGCVVLDNQILVIGGQKYRAGAIWTTNTTEAFDLATGKWSKGINMPSARSCTAVVVDGFVVVLGGIHARESQTIAEVFNPQDKLWRRLPGLAESVNPNALVWAGKYLFLFGDQNRRNRQLVYDLVAKRLVPYPLAMPDGDFAAAVQHADKIYVVGGANIRLEETNRLLQVFSPTMDALTMTAPAPRP